MINKEFIPYEQALALKELHFDEPCFGKYLTSLQSNWEEYELIFEMGMNEEFEDNRNTYILEKACSAPTFSQAFRWFREKYDLNYVIVKTESWFYTINGCNTQEGFNTYEEAELECLKKLIEIVKQ